MKTTLNDDLVLMNVSNDNEVTCNDMDDVLKISSNINVDDYFKAQNQTKLTDVFLCHNGCTVSDYDKNESYSNLHGDSTFVYDVVHQDILSVFENKVIAIFKPEKLSPDSNVQVISFVSDDENFSHELNEKFHFNRTEETKEYVHQQKIQLIN